MSVKPRFQSTANFSNTDYTYYNTVAYNTGTTDMLARFEETRTYPFLDNIEDYEFTITRFKVPSYNFPLFSAEVNGAGDSPTLWVRMQDYDTAARIGHGVPIDVRVPLHFDGAVNLRKQIFDYGEFMDAVNIAINGCFHTFIGEWDGKFVESLVTYVSEPVLSLDNATNKFVLDVRVGDNKASLYYPGIYNVPLPDTADTRKHIVLSFSDELYSFLHGFYSTQVGNEKHVVMMAEQCFKLGAGVAPAAEYNTRTNFIMRVYAEYSSFNAFHKYNRIVFTTMMPIIEENFGFNSISGPNKSTKMLTDYEVTLDDASTNHRDVYMYYLNNDYRWSNFAGNGGIQRVDWQVWIQDQVSKDLIPVYIPPKAEVTAKFLFRKRMQNKIYNYLGLLLESMTGTAADDQQATGGVVRRRK